MVATTDTIERAIVRLTTAELMLGDLPEVAAAWDTLPEGERAAWGIEWDNEMAGLEQVSRLAASGHLTSDLYSRYRSLLVALGESTSLISRLNLTLPPMLRNH